MSAKRIWLTGVLVALLGLTARDLLAQGQVIGTPPTQPADVQGPGGVIGAPAPGGPPAPAQIHYGTGLSSWLLYPRSPGSSGPVGGNGPIGWEGVLRAGASTPVGGNYFAHVFGTGWMIEAGLRSLFFDPTMEGAWTVEVAGGNINADASNRTEKRTLRNIREEALPRNVTIPEISVGMRGMNRTYIKLALGHELWLCGSGEADGESPNWRVGFDGGGRYGTMKLNVTNIRHLTDVVGSVFLAVHSDAEIPYGACVLFMGVRGEWAYTWSDILQRQNDSDLQELNALLCIGFRY